MFCTNCGSPVPDTAQLLHRLRRRDQRADAPRHRQPPRLPPSASPPRAAAAPPAESTCAPRRSNHLPLVRRRNLRRSIELPALRRHRQSASSPQRIRLGQLPGRKDMAKLQFGNSFCQIEGLYVPVADVESRRLRQHLFHASRAAVERSAGEHHHHVARAGWKRMFAGLPLIMMQAQGPGHIAFSRDAPGEMIALPLQPGEAGGRARAPVHARHRQRRLRLVRDQHLVHHAERATTRKRIIRWACSWIASLPRKRRACLLLHAAGNVFVRELGARRDYAGEAHRADLQRSHGRRCNCISSIPARASAGLRMGSSTGAIDIFGCDCGDRGASRSNRSSIAWKARSRYLSNCSAGHGAALVSE